MFDWITNDVALMRHQIATQAGDCLGRLENPLWSNRGAEIQRMLDAGQIPDGGPWCAAFVTYIWGLVRPVIETPPAGYHPALVADWARWGHDTKRFRAAADAEIGDVLLYDFVGSGVPHHCGIIVRVAPLLLVVEGNTDETGSPEGIGVFLRDRTEYHHRDLTRGRPALYGAVTPVPA